MVRATEKEERNKVRTAICTLFEKGSTKNQLWCYRLKHFRDRLSVIDFSIPTYQLDQYGTY